MGSSKAGIVCVAVCRLLIQTASQAPFVLAQAQTQLKGIYIVNCYRLLLCGAFVSKHARVIVAVCHLLIQMTIVTGP
jgi:hypothetical protein